MINANISVNYSQNGSIGHTAGGHFIHNERHVHVLDHGPFTDIVSALAIYINDLDRWKKTSKKHGCISSPRILKMTVIVYDNKNLHITELEETWPVFILFISNKIERPGSKKLTGRVRGNRQSFFFGLMY